MSSIERDLLRQSHVKNFAGLEKGRKCELMKSQQVVVSAKESMDISRLIEVFEANGFTSISYKEIFLALAKLIIDQNIDLSFGQSDDIGKQIVELLGNIDVEENAEGIRLLSIQNKSIADWIAEPTSDMLGLYQKLLNDKVVISKVIGFINRVVSKKASLIMQAQSFGQFKNSGPRMQIVEETERRSLHGYRNVDKEIDISKTFSYTAILREVYRFASLDEQRKKIECQLKSREISAVPKFRLDQWPKDNLMQHIRRQVEEFLGGFIHEVGYFGDENDLKYQILFRLTSFSLTQLFDDGERMEHLLREKGVFRNWRNIFDIDSAELNSFLINKNVLEKVADEQCRIIAHRLQNSNLPLDEILIKRGIFAQQGWMIKKQGGQILAVQEDGVTAYSSVVELTFSEIDSKLADEFHKDLHYIHTPRTDRAFGLFVKGESLPFSVLAIAKIDRSYKENVLLYQGYDPGKCFDLTRLYSRPGTPGNTSSSMFSLTFSFLKQNLQDTQAVLSSFMPSYATGLSMTSGGFDNPVLIKPNEHKFAPVKIGGKVCYEHLTKRRQKNYDDIFFIKSNTVIANCGTNDLYTTTKI